MLVYVFGFKWQASPGLPSPGWSHMAATVSQGASDLLPRAPPEANAGLFPWQLHSKTARVEAARLWRPKLEIYALLLPYSIGQCKSQVQLRFKD